MLLLADCIYFNFRTKLSIDRFVGSRFRSGNILELKQRFIFFEDTTFQIATDQPY